MASFFETLAFALVIGGQFLAAIVLISKRQELYAQELYAQELYADVRESRIDQDQPQPERREQIGHQVSQSA